MGERFTSSTSASSNAASADESLSHRPAAALLIPEFKTRDIHGATPADLKAEPPKSLQKPALQTPPVPLLPSAYPSAGCDSPVAGDKAPSALGDSSLAGGHVIAGASHHPVGKSS